MSDRCDLPQLFEDCHTPTGTFGCSGPDLQDTGQGTPIIRHLCHLKIGRLENSCNEVTCVVSNVHPMGPPILLYTIKSGKAQV